MKFYLRLIIGIIFMLPLIFMFVFLRLHYTENGKSSVKNVLRFPRLYRIVPIAFLMFCCIISVYILIFQFEDWPAILVFALLALPALVMFIIWSMWKIEMKDDGFVYRNYFGRKTEYKYNELEYVQHPKGLKWFFYKNGKKVLCIAYFVQNGDVLYKRWKRAIKKAEQVTE